MKNQRITKSTDEDILMIEFGDDINNLVFYLCYHRKTGKLNMVLPQPERNIEFDIEEFQKLVERLKIELKEWAVNVADKN